MMNRCSKQIWFPGLGTLLFLKTAKLEKYP
jgi:hypothetical protein